MKKVNTADDGDDRAPVTGADVQDGRTASQIGLRQGAGRRPAPDAHAEDDERAPEEAGYGYGV